MLGSLSAVAGREQAGDFDDCFCPLCPRHAFGAALLDKVAAGAGAGVGAVAVAVQRHWWTKGSRRPSWTTGSRWASTSKPSSATWLRRRSCPAQAVDCGADERELDAPPQAGARLRAPARLGRVPGVPGDKQPDAEDADRQLHARLARSMAGGEPTSGALLRAPRSGSGRWPRRPKGPGRGSRSRPRCWTGSTTQPRRFLVLAADHEDPPVLGAPDVHAAQPTGEDAGGELLDLLGTDVGRAVLP